MSEKTVSIVMATCEGARYIDEQLGSLAEQTLRPCEIIVADDASTDDTLESVQRFARASDVPVRIIARTARLGFRENFLQAAREARGDFVAFCDQDDVWRRDKLERCARYFDDPSVSLIVHPARIIDRESRETGDFPQGIRGTTVRAPLSYDPWGTFWGFSITYRRSLLDVFPPDGRFIDYISPRHLIAHDRWISFLGQMVGATVEIDEPLVGYRQHETNVFGQGLGNRLALGRDARDRSDVYLKATRQMLRVVSAMPADLSARFPLYSKGRCVDFVRRALAQLEARAEIYRSPSRSTALRYTCAALQQGNYRGVNDGRIRWRSLGRDLQYLALQA